MAKRDTNSLLSVVEYPEETRDFSVGQLKQLSAELRQETIECVSITGGHLGASLGVVELTVVLHHVFEPVGPYPRFSATDGFAQYDRALRRDGLRRHPYLWASTKWHELVLRFTRATVLTNPVL